MSLNKERKSGLPRIAHNNTFDELDIPTVLERVLDKAFTRFEQQFQRMTSVIEGSLGELV